MGKVGEIWGLLVNMLTGEFNVTLDDMGRISLPRRFRDILEKEKVVLTKGEDNCIWLYTASHWKELEKEIFGTTTQFSKQDLAMRRRFGPTHELDIDKQGRVLVAQSLRDYAGLVKECVVLGQYNYVEIWAENRYKAYLEASEEQFRAASEELSGRIKKERELGNYGNSSHSGTVGTNDAVSGAERQA